MLDQVLHDPQDHHEVLHDPQDHLGVLDVYQAAAVLLLLLNLPTSSQHCVLATWRVQALEVQVHRLELLFFNRKTPRPPQYFSVKVNLLSLN